MNKTYCDRCGKECIDRFWTIDIVAEDVKKEQPGTVTFSTAMYNTSKAMQKFSGKNKQYCIECIEKIEEYIENIPTETIKEKDTKECENIAERYADCDEFVCSKCGIHLMEWVKVSIDEDYDETHCEYEFKYCPNCGAKIKVVE